MTADATNKRAIQKLQRAIVDGLEDVKAQDIRVYNTEQLSPLFERVIIASGTSNRQTKALAASIRDAVREAGFDKPRTEGEENGEWIIVDCGSAVAHVMQPAIRQYYQLEEIWGETPVRLKLGAPKPVKASVAEIAVPVPAKRGAGGGRGAKGKVVEQERDIASERPVVKPGRTRSVQPALATGAALAASKSVASKRMGVSAGSPLASKAAPKKSAAPRAVKTVVVGAPVRGKAARGADGKAPSSAPSRTRRTAAR
jgi:ribosome-associated protein